MPRKTLADLKPAAQRPARARQVAKDEAPPKEPQGAVLGSTRQAAVGSYAVVGLDTSLTSIAAVALGYDGLTRKHSVTHGEIRWTPEVDYFKRLGEAARSHDLILDLLRPMWVVDPSRVFIAMEEPIFYGAVRANIGSFIKQQCEIGGCVKGALVRYGFENLAEVGNSSWKKTLRVRYGVKFETVPRGTSATDKKKINLRNKMAIKAFAIHEFGLPDLPDLVRSKEGAKIPRPESGYGAKAQAEQPSDVYDAAGVAAWFMEDLETRGVLDVS